jgi:hypothetical protein
LLLEFVKLIALGLEIENDLLSIRADVISDLGEDCRFPEPLRPTTMRTSPRKVRLN